MEYSLVFSEITLKRLPLFLVLIIILLLGLPYIGMNLAMNSIGFSSKTNTVTTLYELHIHNYLKQTLLEWSVCSLALITIALAFTQYKIANNKIALIIGLSLLFSGTMETLQLIFIDNLSQSFVHKVNIDALIWICSNSGSGLILTIGLSLFLRSKNNKRFHFTTVCLIVFLIFATATLLIYSLGSLKETPQMWFKEFYLSRPYELISIGIYLFLIVFIIPKVYRKQPSILADCLFYIAITQIVIALYLTLLSSFPYDNAFTIAYFLKTIACLIPFICLIMNYVFSYSTVLNTQTELQIRQSELSYLASHDPLTSLFNRNEFEELLDNAISNASKADNSLALLLIDLDNFKNINDNFNHIQGDELLKQFAKRLSALTRKDDYLSRIGGDEFALIITNPPSPSAAGQLAERVLGEINNPYPINGKLITVTASVGVVLYPNDGNTTEDLLKKADLAMYKAKNSGKNTYQFYTNQLSHSQHRASEVETHLRKALQNNEFELYFQPQYNLVNQKIVGAEILLRWNNETLGAVTPDEFIPIAESTGLIIDLGHWVLRKACEQIMKWKSEYNTMLCYSVNVSPIQLAHSQFLDSLKKALTDYNYPAECLEIEITENIFRNNTEDVNQVLTGISNLGIRISLDDFGKEYSSLNRLKTLPFDVLKIDKEFIADINDKKDEMVFVDIIIKLAESLGMRIVAEGIETEEQLSYLIAQKCHLGQGVLLSPPLTAEEFVKLAYVC